MSSNEFFESYRSWLYTTNLARYTHLGAVHRLCLMAPADARLLEFGPDDNPTADQLQQAFCHACSTGCLDDAKWLASKYPLTGADVRCNSNAPLRYACRSGSLPLVAWLIEEFALTDQDVHAMDGFALRAARAYGWNDVADWLADRFGMDAPQK